MTDIICSHIAGISISCSRMGTSNPQDAVYRLVHARTAPAYDLVLRLKHEARLGIIVITSMGTRLDSNRYQPFMTRIGHRFVHHSVHHTSPANIAYASISMSCTSFDGEEWCWWRDSNSQPPDYKSGALPIEPHQHVDEYLKHVPITVKGMFIFYRWCLSHS